MNEIVVAGKLRSTQKARIVLCELGGLGLLITLINGHGWPPMVHYGVTGFSGLLLAWGLMGFMDAEAREQRLDGTRFTHVGRWNSVTVDLAGADRVLLERKVTGEWFIHYMEKGARRTLPIEAGEYNQMVTALELLANKLPPDRVLVKRTRRGPLERLP